MRSRRLLGLLCLSLAVGLAAVPSTGAASTKKKPRCHTVAGKKHGQKRRVCKKRKPPRQVEKPPSVVAGPPAPAPASPGTPGGPAGGGGEPEYEPPEGPGPIDPPSQYERVDLISNNGFEEAESPTSCFEAFAENQGSVASTATNPIAGEKSLAASVFSFGKVACIHDYPFEGGPIAKAVTVEGKVRIDAPTSGQGLEVCAVVYFENDSDPASECETRPLADHGVAEVSLSVDAEEKRIQRAFFQLQSGSTGVEATLDEAHLYVDRLKGSEGGDGGNGGGGGSGGGGSNVGRFAAMVSPTDGETLTTPLDLRLVGAGYDPNIPTNEPVAGKGSNAAKVEFLLDGAPILEQNGSDAEYWIFKGLARDLDIAPGQHTVTARATYENPDLVLESEPVTISVENPPVYAQTVNLTQDVVLSGSQSFELIGSPGGRIRLNGNGHRIVSGGTSGDLVLRDVDVYGLGSPDNTSAPGIDVTTTGTTGSVAIEDSIFDRGNPVRLRFNGSSTAALEGNLFRSSMRMPIGQFPGADPVSPIPSTAPVVSISGSSAATKVFAGNNVAAAPVRFEDVNRWTIGGDSDAESNVLIGPRASFEVLDSSNVTVEGNFVDHTYYGGWSMGQLLELHGSRPLSVKHNVLIDSSWPVRGIGDEFAYNLVLEAGHQWMVPDNGAYIHHNIFVGGDNDTGGITGYYEISARIENNTFDGLLGGMVHSAITWQKGQTTLRSNALVGIPTWAAAAVDRQGGTIDAGFNGFFNPLQTNYLGGVTAVGDLGGGASTSPRFAGPLPTETFEGDKVAVWNRDLTVSEILSAYRARYTPTQGSAYIDSGDPGGGVGNDVGAVGAGAVNSLDRFGSFAQSGWTPPPTPPSP
jgi:hypothetical protein